MIAITISTNYSDLIKLIIDSNLKYFKKWIFVTDVNDIETIERLTEYNVVVLYFDFKNNNRIFDKGGAVALAQQFAYKHYPEDWYLLLDSDICLSSDFGLLKQDISNFDKDAVYGAKTRHDFSKYSSFLKNEDYFEYPWGDQLQGYFQLYKKHFYYKSSFDASACDLEFLNNFQKKIVIEGFVCKHLGRKGHWTGRLSTDDFIFD